MWKEYDIEIPVPAGELSKIKQWVANFNSHQPILIANPEIKNQQLRMNAADASTFFAYFANPSESNEFEVFRLKRAVVANVERLLRRSRSIQKKRHYQSCLSELTKKLAFEGLSKHTSIAS